MDQLPKNHLKISRRHALGWIGGAALTAAAGQTLASEPRARRKIPSTGEMIPAIGMGTWITFNVGRDQRALATRKAVLQAFFDAGGGMIDSSPMYGSSEEVVGRLYAELGRPRGLFSATKVWTSSASRGRSQIEDSFRLWRLRRMDLQQVHNLLGWQAQLKTLEGLKAEGRIRYIGVTTSHGRRHGELETIMRTRDIDFVQLTYNAVDREAESRLLPLAAERGIAVIANRPFDGGSLIDRAKRHKLPGWAAEAGARNWAEFLLKFIVSHPALTCAIPATSKPDHMRENMAAGLGPMPDAALRRRMAALVRSL